MPNDVVCMFANDMDRSEYIDIADKLADDLTLNMACPPFCLTFFVTYSIDGNRIGQER